MSNEPKTTSIDTKSSVDKGLSLKQAFGLAWEMGYLLAIPLVVLALTGRLLDRHYDTSPLFLLIGIILSVVISSTLLAKRAIKIIKEVSSTETGKKDSN